MSRVVSKTFPTSLFLSNIKNTSIFSRDFLAGRSPLHVLAVGPKLGPNCRTESRAASGLANASLSADKVWIKTCSRRHTSPSFYFRRLNSTVSSWSELIQSVTQSTSLDTDLGLKDDKSHDSNVCRVKEQLKQALTSRRSHEQGNLLPSVIASEICKLYELLDSQSDKLAFFTLLSTSLDVDHEVVSKAIATFSRNTSQEEATFLKARERLASSLDPAYKHLLKDIGHLEEGVRTLVNMRKDLLELFADKSVQGISPHLHAFERHLKQHLAQWFSAGFLDLQRVTWNSPAALLEKIMMYEQVHPTSSWNDFKRRLDVDRRCFIFSHRLLPGEPLVILHTALGDHLRANMQGIHVQSSMNNDVTAATFYSISSTQKGLSGIDLGNYLIKVVAQESKKEFPTLLDLGTLSPIPGFAKWLTQKLKSDQDHLSELWKKSSLDQTESFSTDSFKEWLNQLKHHQDTTTNGIEFDENNKKFLLALCARYLYCEKRRGFALDPVANFHLRNGAILWRLNWMADESNRGMDRSYGIMTNYKYDLSQIEGNNKQYVINGKIAVSDSVHGLIA